MTQGHGEIGDRIVPAGGARGSFHRGLALSTGWIVGATWLGRLLGLVNTLVIARLLAPDDFGVFAIGLVFMQILLGFTDVGLSQAVVRFRDASRADMDTLFTLSLLRGGLCAAVMIVAAPYAVAIYDDARLLGVFAGLAGVPLLTGLVNPRFYEFERRSDFRAEFVLTLANKVVSVAVSIGVAVALRSYWAIVAGLLAGGVTQVVISYALRPELPRLTLSSFRRVFGFTGWITLVAVFAALNNKLDAMIFGRIVGEAGAGQLYVGEQLAELPTRDLATPLARAIYPGLSALQDEPGAMRTAYLQGIEVLGAVALPAAIGFAVVAEHAVPVLLGHRWDGAVPVIQVIGPVLGLQCLFMTTQAYAMARGLTWIVCAREALFFCVRTPIVVLALLQGGFEAGVHAIAACGLFHVALNMGAYARLSGDAFWRPLAAAWRSLLACGALAATVLWAKASGFAPGGGPFDLAALVGLGGTAYLAAHAALWLASGRPDGVESSVIGAVRRAA
jgi:PST family polysaccharide transporter